MTMLPQFQISKEENNRGLTYSDTDERISGNNFDLTRPTSLESKNSRKSILSGKMFDFHSKNNDTITPIKEQPKIVESPFEEIDKNQKFMPHSCNAIPTCMLNRIVNNYIRSADQNVPIVIYDCECWTDPTAVEIENPTNPGITIPFCARVELGLGVAMNKFIKTKYFQSQFNGFSTKNNLDVDPSFDEVLLDKEFSKTMVNIDLCTPELNISVRRKKFEDDSSNSLAQDEVENLFESSYVSLVISSIPKYCLPIQNANNTIEIESRNFFF